MWSLLACCLQCIWGLIEYITKFATVRAAITGEAFFTAGRNVTQLLTRNFLKAYGAGWPDPTLFIPLVIGALSAVVLFDITSRVECCKWLCMFWGFHLVPRARQPLQRECML